MTTVNLSLAEDGRNFIEEFSSGQYQSLMFAAFMPADDIYTYLVRYLQLFGHDIPNDHKVNGYSKLSAIFLTVVIAGLSLANLYNAYRNLKKEKQKNSYRFIHDKLPAEDLARQARIDQEAKCKSDLLNKYFREALVQSDLKDKYESLELLGAPGKERLKMKLKSPPPTTKPGASSRLGKWIDKKIVTPFIGPIWDMLGISSYAYWLLFIGSGVLVSAGLATLSLGSVFCIPFVMGGIYGLIKTVKHIRNKILHKPSADAGETAATYDQELEAQKDASRIMKQVALRVRYESAKTALIAELGDAYDASQFDAEKYKQQANLLITAELKNSDAGEHIALKTAASGFSNTLAIFSGLQYAAWIITDALSKLAKITSAIPIVNLVCGAAFIGVSGLVGLVKMYVRYNAVKDDNKKKTLSTPAVSQAELKNYTDTVKKLEESYNKKLAAINTLKLELVGDTQLPEFAHYKEPKFFNDVTLKPNYDKGWRKHFNRVVPYLEYSLQFINNFASGVFLSRLLLVKGTAIFLPFVAASLSNPITIGLIIGIGVAFAAYKTYEFYRDQKEKRAQELLNQKSERIDHLTKQLELMDLTHAVLTKRNNQRLGLGLTEDKKPVLQQHDMSSTIAPASPKEEKGQPILVSVESASAADPKKLTVDSPIKDSPTFKRLSSDDDANKDKGPALAKSVSTGKGFFDKEAQKTGYAPKGDLIVVGKGGHSVTLDPKTRIASTAVVF
jgi:hypothetical protein